jgi:hypothetical protein
MNFLVAEIKGLTYIRDEFPQAGHPAHPQVSG